MFALRRTVGLRHPQLADVSEAIEEGLLLLLGVSR